MSKKKRKEKPKRNTGITQLPDGFRVDFDAFSRFMSEQVEASSMVRDNLSAYIKELTTDGAAQGIPPLLGQFMWGGVLLTALAMRMASQEPGYGVHKDLAEVSQDSATQEECSVAVIYTATLAAFKYRTSIYINSPEEMSRFFVEEYALDPMDMGRDAFSAALTKRLKGHMPFLPGAYYGSNKDLLDALG